MKGTAQPLNKADIRNLALLGLTMLILCTWRLGATWWAAALICLGYIGLIWLYWRYRRHQNRQAKQKETLGAAEIYRLSSGLIDIMPQAIAIIDQNYDIHHANAAAVDLMKIEDFGVPLANYVSHPDINKHLSRGLAGYEPEPLMLHIEEAREQYIRLLFSRAHSYRPTEAVSFIFVVFDDVTDMNFEQQRRADFLANASHELKTPIASLVGYIETLRGHAKDDPAAQEKFLGIMQQQAERMQRLINDLLSLRRIELTEDIVPSETADLHLAITAAMEVVGPLCERRKITLNYKPVGRNQALIRGKQDECVQLCLNLIENAAKISPRDSEITIKLRKLEQWSPLRAFEDAKLPQIATSRRIVNAPPSPLPGWLITISDNGPGFGREHVPRIGERFYRIAGDLSSQEKGTGLGLAIVKHIIKRHRGGLYVRSEAGYGTDFSILLMAANIDDTQQSS